MLLNVIRPLLEFSSPAWNPCLLRDINLLENVQRSFTRKVCILCNLPVACYSERLSILNLERLELKRLRRINLLEIFKLVHNFTVCSVRNSLQFYSYSTTRLTRGHRFKLILSRCNKNVFKHFFSNRVLPVWNYLPDCCFNSDILSVFKRKLCAVDLNVFLHGRL